MAEEEGEEVCERVDVEPVEPPSPVNPPDPAELLDDVPFPVEDGTEVVEKARPVSARR